MDEIDTLIVSVGLILLLMLLEFRNAESQRDISPNKNGKQIAINDSIFKKYENLKRKVVLIEARKAGYFSREFTKSPALDRGQMQ